MQNKKNKRKSTMKGQFGDYAQQGYESLAQTHLCGSITLFLGTK